jgi:hypothetical protein
MPSTTTVYVLIILAFILFTFVLRRSSFYYHSGGCALRGEDKRMGGASQVYENYIAIRVDIHTYIDGDQNCGWQMVSHEFVSRVKNSAHLWFCQQNCPLLARTCQGDDGSGMWYRFVTTHEQEVVEGLFVHVEDHDITDTRAIEYAHYHGINACIIVTPSGFYFVINHQFIDGVTALRFLRDLTDSPETLHVPEIRYVPIVSDLIRMLPIVPSCMRLMYAYSNRRTAREFRMTTPTGQPVIRYMQYVHLNTAHIRRIRTHVQCSFACVMSAWAACCLFRRLDEDEGEGCPVIDTLRVAVIHTMSGACRFNNYGVVIADVSRPANLYTKGGYTGLIEAANELRDGLHASRMMSVASYIAINAHAIGVNTVQGIDLLVSGVPLSCKSDGKILGRRIVRCTEFNPFTSYPAYIMYVGTNLDTHVSWTSTIPGTTFIPTHTIDPTGCSDVQDD